MRLGYDYALGGGGTTNGDSGHPSGGAAAGGADTGRGGAVPAARAHKGPVPRREFGSPPMAGGGGVGVGGIGSPPFAAGPPAAAAGASAAASAPASAGGGKKVGFTPFGDGKKAADGKCGRCPWSLWLGPYANTHTHTHVVGIIFSLLFHICT